MQKFNLMQLDKLRTLTLPRKKYVLNLMKNYILSRAKVKMIFHRPSFIVELLTWHSINWRNGQQDKCWALSISN